MLASNAGQLPKSATTYSRAVANPVKLPSGVSLAFPVTRGRPAGRETVLLFSLQANF